MDPKVMQSTQDSLGKIIKKPPLTDKLLSKPPFRFLHDIMTSVIKTTGFMKGLFTDTEMSSDNVKDKDSKMAFLQKAVDMVSLVLGSQLSVRPSKIVAGHEPEKTNEFLQALATAVNKNINSDEFVQRVLKGDKGVKESKSKDDKKEKEKNHDKGDRDEKHSREKSSDRKKEDKEGHDRSEKRERSRDKEKNPEEKDSKREKDRHRGKDREKDGEKDKDRGKDKDKERDKRKDRESRDKDRDHRGKEGRDKDRDQKDRDQDKDRDKDSKSKKHRKEEAQKENESPDLEDEPHVNGETGEISDPPTKKAERPASAKGSRRRREGQKVDSSDEEDLAVNQLKTEVSGTGTLGEDDLPPQVAEARRLARPSSARPAAPRVKNKDVVSDEPSMRLGSGRPTNVIVDNDQSDDDDNFMVEESAPQPMTIEREKTIIGVDNDEEHGGLVKKILESKKEFEGGNQQSPTVQKKTEIERPTMSDAARRKEREMVQKEIDKLRGSIQTVTRSANPLGKIMDYVQEDLDAMQKELDVWKKENKEQGQALKREQSITDKAIEPLKAQLSEIDQAIVDQLDLIAAVKSNIINNDQKIEKMLRSIGKS